jgi:hypothetical protein
MSIAEAAAPLERRLVRARALTALATIAQRAKAVKRLSAGTAGIAKQTRLGRTANPQNLSKKADGDVKDYGEHDAQDEAGDDREKEPKAVTLEGYVPREPVQKGDPRQEKNRRASEGDQGAHDEKKAANGVCIHVSILATRPRLAWYRDIALT